MSGEGKTLVTGAAGFIGHHVVRLLRAEGRAVRAMLRPGEDARNLDGLGDAGIERVEGDVLDAARMREVVEGCDRVYHLAAIYALWLPDPQRLWDVNLLGTQNVLEACAAAGVERVVYTSSIAAVGGRPGDAPADETVAYNLWRESNDYVRTKYLSERLALGYSDRLDVVAVNPGMPMGPGDVGPTPTGQLLLDVLRGDLPPVIFDGGLNLVDVEDVARGHLLAEARGGRGERYLLTGHNLRNVELPPIIERVCGVRRRFVTAPRWVPELYGAISEWVSDHVTHAPPILTRQSVRYAAQHLAFDNSKAREELGYTVRPLEETIARAADWFRDNGYLDRPSTGGLLGFFQR